MSGSVEIAFQGEVADREEFKSSLVADFIHAGLANGQMGLKTSLRQL